MKKEIAFTEKLASPIRRILSFLADALIFFILTAAIYTVGIFKIVESTPNFSNAKTEQETSLKACKDIYFDSHIAIKNYDGSVKGTVDTIRYYIETKTNEQPEVTDGKYKDVFYYYYLNYANNRLMHNGVVDTYTLEYVNNLFTEDNVGDVQLWDTSDNSAPIVLKSEEKALIKEYLKGSDHHTKENEGSYKKIYAFAEKQFGTIDKLIANSDQYKNNYEKVLRNNDIIYYSITASCTITYVVFFAVYFVVIPLFLKNGQTLGKRILSIRIVDSDEKPIRNREMILRAVLQCLCYSFGANFIPYLVLGIGIIQLPLITIGGFTIKFFVFSIVTLLISIVSFIILCAKENKQALHDLAVGAYAIDTRNVYKKENNTEDRVINSPFLEDAKKEGEKK